MKLKITTVSFVAFALLSGCGIIEKNITSEESIKDKASFAIGAAPSEIEISNVQSGIDRITFDAEAGGSQYRCYYTTAVAIKSDALCRKMGAQAGDETESSGQCNALLKAAGYC